MSSNKQQRKPKPVDDADRLLAPENFAELNKYFYMMKPFQYFDMRLKLLMLMTKPDDIDPIFAQGLTVGGLKVYREEEGELGDEDSDRYKKFVVVDAAFLLHHVSETLLRMYLVHEAMPRCPWLELSRERNFARFKSKLKKRFVDLDFDEARARLPRLFYGHEKREDFSGPPMPEAEWNDGPANIESFLRYLARLLLDDANVYNAAKHGLALMAGESMFKLGDGKIVGAEGPSIMFLEVLKTANGGSRWNQSTKWVNIDEALPFVAMANELFKQLWNVARLRYVGGEGIRIGLFAKPKISDIIKRAFVTDDLKMELLYYVDAEEPAEV
ncbi:MAG: hypothetical protein WEB06_03150 [Actinomycetota bacterium]